MSMLAERKRKQKWSLNPRGNDWSQDSNKFGQKLMEKMGWSPGKGLGRKEDGVTDHIKVSYKNDSVGMGFKETDDQWTEHVTMFSDLLKSLNGNTEENHKVQSLEEKSQNSRARVHYKKFTKGKDLSRYSEKELANIFGMKSLSQCEKNKKEEIKNYSATSVYDKSLINSGSMLDYFKKKLPSFGKKKELEDVNKNSDEETEHRIGFGYSTDNFQNGINNETFTSNYSDQVKTKNEITMDISVDSEVTKKEKKSKKRKREESDDYTENFEVKTSKKSKKKQFELNSEANGLVNPAFSDIPVKTKRRKLDIISEENEVNSSINESVCETKSAKENMVADICTDSTKKIKKKKKRDLQDDIIDPNENNSIIKNKNNVNEHEICSNLSKKKKKSKKEPVDNGIENVAFNDEIDSSCQLNESELSYEVTEKKKKKKKSKGIQNLAFEELGKNETVEDIDVPSTEEPITKTPKDKVKNKKKKEAYSYQETELLEKNPYEVVAPQKFKKRKDKDLAIENPAFDLNATSTLGESYTNPEFEVDRRNTLKLGIENPTLNIERSPEKNTLNQVCADEPVMDIMLNVAVLPVKEIPKPKSKQKNVRFSAKNQEIYFNNAESPINYKQTVRGTENKAFDRLGNQIEENINNLTKSLDNYQASMENELNQAKINFFVGEMGDQNEENQILPDGTVKLKYKYANFGKSPRWFHKADQEANIAKKSYKNSIKGDITIAFKGTNLHEVKGYGNKT